MKEMDSLLAKGPLFWAWDPQEVKKLDPREILGVVRLFREKAEEIRPIAIVPPPDAQETPRIDRHLVAEVKRIQKKFPRDQVRAPEIVVQAEPSMQQTVEAFLQHAANQKVKLIFLKTHDHQGFAWLQPKGFAETLVSLSSIPVLLLGPHCHSSRRMKTILFPTDVSDESRRVFLRLLPWARERNAEIFLFHIESTEAPLLIRPWIEGIWERGLDVLRKKVRAWAVEAEKFGVSCEAIFETSEREEEGIQVIQVAKHLKADLIVSKAKTDSLEMFPFGSDARRVLAEAHCPLLIMRP